MTRLINRIRWEIWCWKSIWRMPPFYSVDRETWELLMDRSAKDEPVEGRPKE